MKSIHTSRACVLMESVILDEISVPSAMAMLFSVRLGMSSGVAMGDTLAGVFTVSCDSIMLRRSGSFTIDVTIASLYKL